MRQHRRHHRFDKQDIIRAILVTIVCVLAIAGCVYLVNWTGSKNLDQKEQFTVSAGAENKEDTQQTAEATEETTEEAPELSESEEQSADIVTSPETEEEMSRNVIKLKDKDNNEYDVKDAAARTDIQGLKSAFNATAGIHITAEGSSNTSGTTYTLFNFESGKRYTVKNTGDYNIKVLNTYTAGSSGVTSIQKILSNKGDKVTFTATGDAAKIGINCMTSNGGSWVVSYDENGRVDNLADEIIMETKGSPVLFDIPEPVQPEGTGIANMVTVNSCIDAENICTEFDVTLTNASTVLFIGSVNIVSSNTASHIQFDFGNGTMAFYAKGSGAAIPSSVIHTESISSIVSGSKYKIRVGRKNRHLFATVENSTTGASVSYTVGDGNANQGQAGWFADKLTYGIISGAITFNRITATTRCNPNIVFIGDSITEGYGIAYENSWAAKAAEYFGN